MARRHLQLIIQLVAAFLLLHTLGYIFLHGSADQGTSHSTISKAVPASTPDTPSIRQRAQPTSSVLFPTSTKRPTSGPTLAPTSPSHPIPVLFKVCAAKSVSEAWDVLRQSRFAWWASLSTHGNPWVHFGGPSPQSVAVQEVYVRLYRNQFCHSSCAAVRCKRLFVASGNGIGSRFNMQALALAESMRLVCYQLAALYAACFVN
jgi:hypothetical protein